jgi:predicted solute-binding protein
VGTPDVAAAFRESCRYGLERMDEIVAAESAARGFAPALVREYLTRHIVHQLGPREYAGMDLFLRYARENLRESLVAPAAPVRAV